MSDIGLPLFQGSWVRDMAPSSIRDGPIYRPQNSLFLYSTLPVTSLDVAEQKVK